MKEISLLGRLGAGKNTIIDDDDFKKVSQYKWYWDGHYVIRYLDARVGSSQRLHRLVLNAQGSKQIDHIDRDPLNNQKSNLRFCTPRENLLNRTPRIINYKKYKILTKNSTHEITCRICERLITVKEPYYDGQKRNRAHTACVA